MRIYEIKYKQYGSDDLICSYVLFGKSEDCIKDSEKMFHLDHPEYRLGHDVYCILRKWRKI